MQLKNTWSLTLTFAFIFIKVALFLKLQLWRKIALLRSYHIVFSFYIKQICQVTDDPFYISLNTTTSHNHLFYFFHSNGLPISPVDKMRKPTLVTLLAGALQHASIFKKKRVQ